MKLSPTYLQNIRLGLEAQRIEVQSPFNLTKLGQLYVFLVVTGVSFLTLFNFFNS